MTLPLLLHSRYSLIFAAALAALFSILKVPQALLPPQFWAEEASIFFLEDKLYGTEALTRTYAGYLHLLPRIISYTFSWVPLEFAPAVYKASSVITVFGLGLLIGNLRLQVDRVTRFCMIALIALIPSNGEVFLNTANTITLAGAAFVLLFMQDPAREPLKKSLDLFLILILGLSGAFILFLFPLIGLRIWRTDLKEGIYYRAYVLGVVTAIAWLTYSPGARLAEPYSPDVHVWIDSVFKFPRVFLFANLPFGGTLFNLLGLAPFLGIFLIFKAELKRRPFFDLAASPSVFLIIIGLAVWAASLWAFKLNPNSLNACGDGGRYFYIPYLFLAYAFLMSTNTAKSKRFLNGMVLISICSSPTFFRSNSINSAYRDYEFSKQAREIREGRAKTLLVPPGWEIPLNEVDDL